MSSSSSNPLFSGCSIYRLISQPSLQSRYSQIMSQKRKGLFNRLLRLVGKGNQVQSSKMCLAQIYEERKKQRQRSSLSSHLSHVEPMPTIQEEDESLFGLDEYSTVHV